MRRTQRKLDHAYENALCLTIHMGSRIVMMSDCHRGIGNWGDNFQANQNLFFAALQYYNQRKFVYIELGDGDELWENRDLREIVRIHSNQFWMMEQFYRDGRLHMLYGNHDRKKAQGKYFQNACRMGACSAQGDAGFFHGMKVEEAIRLKDSCSGLELLLVHGHQGDFWNDTLWKVTRFLVRYLWRPLELAGCNDPTSAAKNYQKKERVEQRLSAWANRHKSILIAGHTHRPAFPKPGDGYYFNDGSCVHPRCITALEIERGSISLVKWSVKVREDNMMYIGRDVLEGPVPLKEFAGITKSV
ncbi:MAG: serine/threonine protein phosphatase [Lachnospiraceae bacterium]|jgi:UDP-2,3-diacylglucosamine pyrophosphatase LpxH|nr:serine/threonine protein phosphatase [Lachnospiraceae bacterium]